MFETNIPETRFFSYLTQAIPREFLPVKLLKPKLISYLNWFSFLQGGINFYLNRDGRQSDLILKVSSEKLSSFSDFGKNENHENVALNNILNKRVRGFLKIWSKNRGVFWNEIKDLYFAFENLRSNKENLPPSFIVDLSTLNFLIPQDKMAFIKEMMLCIGVPNSPLILNQIKKILDKLNFPTNLYGISFLTNNEENFAVKLILSPIEVENIIPLLRKIDWNGEYNFLASKIGNIFKESSRLALCLSINKPGISNRIEIENYVEGREKNIRFLELLLNEKICSVQELQSIKSWIGKKDLIESNQGIGRGGNDVSFENSIVRNIGHSSIFIEENNLGANVRLNFSYK